MYTMTYSRDWLNLDDLRDLNPIHVKDLSFVKDLLEKGEEVYTARVDGVVCAIFGTVRQWEGRSLAWSVMGEGARTRMHELTQSAIEWLDSRTERRLEIDVDERFDAGIRWAFLMGFRYESTMHKYSETGEDVIKFVRIKGDEHGKTEEQ